MIFSRERILTTHVGSLPRNDTLSDLPVRQEGGQPFCAAEMASERVVASADCGFGTFTNRDWVIEPAVWLKLKALRDGADIASARLWGKQVAAE